MKPLITEKGGTVKFQDLIDNKTLTEQTDDLTGSDFEADAANNRTAAIGFRELVRAQRRHYREAG